MRLLKLTPCYGTPEVANTCGNKVGVILFQICSEFGFWFSAETPLPNLRLKFGVFFSIGGFPFRIWSSNLEFEFGVRTCVAKSVILICKFGLGPNLRVLLEFARKIPPLVPEAITYANKNHAKFYPQF